MIDLGKWALIDIETTGVDPAYDQIIDVGFLQFDGLKLVSKYSSLVKTELELSKFIQKLTKITPEMARRAPDFKNVWNDVSVLYGHTLLAHNADFEVSFLEEHFEKIEDSGPREKFVDSIYFLSLLFPQFESLKLEHFIVEFGLADSEVHRGFEDSLDLLKVLLIAIEFVRSDRASYMALKQAFADFGLHEYWFYKLYCLESEEIYQLAEQIEFDLATTLRAYKKKLQVVQIDESVSAPLVDLSFSGEKIKKILQDEERLNQILPSYKYRASQEELALRVGQSFKNSVHALIQAPTGTGKTIGYLIPSTLFAISESKQVLVATGTKTLQHQAINKDVPQVRKILGLDSDSFKIKRLVGSSNHLCESIFRQKCDEEGAILLQTKEFHERFAYLYFARLFDYNRSVEDDLRLLRDAVPYVLKMKNRHLATLEDECAVDFRACTGNGCLFRHSCSYLQGLREAKDANLIIGNHALMFSWPRNFPRPTHIIVDEAHKIEHEATKAFSVEVSQNDLTSLMNNLNHLQGIGSLFYLLAQFEQMEGEATGIINTLRQESIATLQMITDHFHPFVHKIETYFKKMPKYSSQYWNEAPLVTKSASDELALSIHNHIESLRFIITNYYDQINAYAVRFEASMMTSDNQQKAFSRFEAFFGSIEDLKNGLDALINRKENTCYSMHYQETEGFVLSAAPVDVGRVVCEGLLELSSSVVFTSATLANESGSSGARGVEWATGYSYLPPQKRFKSGFFLPAHFDYKNRTKVFLCDDTPALYDLKFVPRVVEVLSPLIESISGRSLLLFSAKNRFEQARELLLERFEGKLPLFIQGMGSNVVEEFKKSGEGILLGMESFGEGIDIPGEALQFLFVDKVPDLRQELVISDRRAHYEQNLGNEFIDYYLSHRTRSLHQKLGRLLRRETDYGGVIIVDSRVRSWKGATMAKVNRLMEPYQINLASFDQAAKSVLEFLQTNHRANY